MKILRNHSCFNYQRLDIEWSLQSLIIRSINLYLVVNPTEKMVKLATLKKFRLSVFVAKM